MGVKYGIKLDFVAITNGTLLSDKICKEMVQNQIRAAISIDGIGPVHDKTRIYADGSGSFKQVERGLNLLQNYHIPFNVSITISSANVNRILEVTKYLINNQIPFVYNFYRENPNVTESLEGDDKKLVTNLTKAYKYIEQHLPPYSLMNNLLDRVSFKKPHLHTCGMGQNYLVIRHDGKLLSCQMTQDKIIGSIEDKDLIDTMRKGNFIRPKGLSVEGKNPCNKCQWKYICCGGCPLLIFSQKGNYHTASPYCLVYKKMIPKVLRLEALRLLKAHH